MNQFPTQNWFQPTQNLEALLPALALISMMLLFVFALAGVIYLWRMQQTQRMEWKRYEVIANRFRLAPREVGLLRRIAQLGGVQPTYKIFRDQARFESAVKASKAAKCYMPSWIIESIRHKLFNMTEAMARLAEDTHGLIPGCSLRIYNQSHNGRVMQGKLLDNEAMGLIIAITSTAGNRVAIHPNNRLAVTASLDDNKIVYFWTKVESVIPGPRKMAVLKHAEFVSPRATAQPTTKEPNPLLKHAQPQGMEAISKG